MAGQVASALRARGIGPGDQVALSCPNVVYFPIVYFGILRAGATVVPLNVLFKPTEIAYHLRDSEATAYFCFEGTPELPMAAMGEGGLRSRRRLPPFRRACRASPGAAVSVDGATSFDAVHRRAARRRARSSRPRADDTAVLLYTSGTTGQPKGAELTHLNILLNAVAVGRSDAGRAAPRPGHAAGRAGDAAAVPFVRAGLPDGDGRSTTA